MPVIIKDPPISLSEMESLVGLRADGCLFWKKRRPGMKVGTWVVPGVSVPKWNGRYAGKKAGVVNAEGYRVLSVGPYKIMAHRIVWLLHYGRWPRLLLDHINHKRTDNRVSNLREATHLDNQRNMKRSKRNSSGVMGVHWDKSRGQWRACIRELGKGKELGRSYCFGEAVRIRKQAARAAGYHLNHGVL